VARDRGNTVIIFDPPGSVYYRKPPLSQLLIVVGTLRRFGRQPQAKLAEVSGRDILGVLLAVASFDAVHQSQPEGMRLSVYSDERSLTPGEGIRS
jgi:hypothetical protein